MIWGSDSGWELIEKSMARGNRLRDRASLDDAGGLCSATDDDLPDIVFIVRRYADGKSNDHFGGMILIVLLSLNAIVFTTLFVAVS